MRGLKTTLVDFSIHHNKLALLGMGLVTVLAGAFLPMAVMDTDPENMLEADEPARVFHNGTKRDFALSDVIVVGVVNDHDPDGVFNLFLGHHPHTFFGQFEDNTNIYTAVRYSF